MRKQVLGTCACGNVITVPLCITILEIFINWSLMLICTHTYMQVLGMWALMRTHTYMMHTHTCMMHVYDARMMHAGARHVVRLPPCGRGQQCATEQYNFGNLYFIGHTAHIILLGTQHTYMYTNMHIHVLVLDVWCAYHPVGRASTVPLGNAISDLLN